MYVHSKTFLFSLDTTHVIFWKKNIGNQMKDSALKMFPIVKIVFFFSCEYKIQSKIKVFKIYKWIKKLSKKSLIFKKQVR